uniref:Periphilin-1 C-terminal domain-containing protein n=1 Tax=Monopterus albus TaxID=43700 RepID=A0A3Q3JU55_MONAL
MYSIFYFLPFPVTYRRERSLREVYDERFLTERSGPYPRAGAVERRAPFGRPEDEYSRGGYEYEGGPRFFPNGGGPRTYHEDQRVYHGDNLPCAICRTLQHQEDYPYRVPREDPHAGRSLEFGTRVPPPHGVRSQVIYPAPRSLPESGEDTLVQAILNLDRGEDRDHYRRKAAPFPPLRERSPVRREVARSPHSRSGSSVSSRGYSPDRVKSLPFPSQQGKKGEKEEPPVAPIVEESPKPTENFQERRALAIAAKAQEIEKVYRQDCETFGMVVKMLVAKDPNLEKQLQVPLRENLGEIRERCLEDLKHFISELDEVVCQPEPSIIDSTTPSMSMAGHKLSKTGVNHSSSF